MKMNDPGLITAPDEIQRELRRMTRRGFLGAGLTTAAAVAGWAWLRLQPDNNGIQWPLRKGLELNERFARMLYEPERLTRTYARPSDAIPRSNGDLGLKFPIDLDSWRLRLDDAGSPSRVVELSLQEIRSLPRTEYISDLMCIEGWTERGSWAGVRFADFVAAYPPRTNLPRYVGFETPDRGYYVGIDMASAMHPQTILCYEMGGAPLTAAHGAPLRLYTPVKYGIKDLKRIGRIFYSNERPPDYWAREGYDYYAGL